MKSLTPRTTVEELSIASLTQDTCCKTCLAGPFLFRDAAPTARPCHLSHGCHHACLVTRRTSMPDPLASCLPEVCSQWDSENTPSSNLRGDRSVRVSGNTLSVCTLVSLDEDPQR